MIGGADSARSWAWTLAAIAAGGAALRLTGMGAESVDLEEYACIGALHTQGLHHFLTEQRALYPYGAPLAPLFFYLWSGLFGVGIVAVRVLSALAGTAMIVLLALLAREIWPANPRTARAAGLIAALCAALSPVHLFQAQEARMYAFVALFAVLSGLSLLRAARTGQRRWWVVNLAANAALVWSHYFAVFIWPVQALWLLCAPGVRWRTLLLWLIAQALLLVPVAMWISGIAPQPKELHDYYTMPEPGLVARNLVAGDAVNWSSSSYFPSGRAWSFAPEAVRQAVVAAHPLGDVLIAAAFSAALLWGFLRLFKRRAARDAHTGYLVLWAVLPLLALVALSFAWKPVYASRYLAHSSLALYLLLGGLMAQLPGGRFRVLCVAVLVTVYGWQLSLCLPPQTRTAWKQTGQAIAAADGERAITLVQGVFWKPIFETNLPTSDRIVTAVLEPEAMAEMGAFLARTIAVLEPGANPSCWAVLVDTIHGQPGRFEAAAAPWNVRLEKREFPGERQLDAYRISPASDVAQAKNEAPLPALLDLAKVLAGHAGDPAIAAFQEAIRTRTDAEGGGYLRLGVDLAQHGRTALAAAVLDEAIARFPAHLVDLVSLQRVLSGKGDLAPLADHAFDRIKTAPERISTLRQVLQSLVELGETDALRDAAQRMITAFPDYSQGYAYLGKSDYDEERYDDAFRNLERAMALDPVQPGYIYFELGDLYDRMGRCPDALRVLEQGAAQKPLDAVLALRLANAHLDCGDAARAMAITTEQLDREAHANDGVVQGVAGSAPAVLLDLARIIADHADTPAVAAFQETIRARGGLEGGGYLRLGVDLARRGRVPLAAAALDEALARFPAQLVDLALLQRELSGQAGFVPLADRVFERIKPHPERISTLHLVLQSLMKHHEKDALREIARKMIQVFPDYSAGYAYLGKSDYDDRQCEQALPNLEHAVMLDPAQPAYICYALGDLYIRGGRCPDALRVLEQGHALEPRDGELALKLANTHIDCGDAAQAEALTTEQLKREPQTPPSPGVVQGVSGSVPAVLLYLASAIANNADAPAVAEFQDSMRMRSGPEGGGYLRLGVDLARKGRVSLAAAVLDQALAHCPAHLVDLAFLQSPLTGQRDFARLADRAIDHVRAFPERISTLKQVLQSLFEYKESGALREVASRIVAAFPDYSPGCAYLGKQLYDDGDYAGLRNLERAVALDPVQPGYVYHALGDLYTGMGRCADALRVLEQGLALEPLDGGTMLMLANAHLGCGDAQRALELTTEQLKRDQEAEGTPQDSGFVQSAFGPTPALLDLIHAIADPAAASAVAVFQETLFTRPGLEGGGYLRLGVDLARRGKEELAAKVLDRALAQWPPHLLDLAVLLSSLSGSGAKKS